MCCCNIFIGHMDPDGDSLDDDTICKEREEQLEWNDKRSATNESNNKNKKAPVSCNYFMMSCYIIIVKKYVFILRRVAL